MAAPRDRHHPGLPEDTLRFPPARHLRERVSADYEVKVDTGTQLSAEVADGIDAVGGPGSVDVDAGHAQARLPGDCQFDHREAVLCAAANEPRFHPRPRRGNKQYLGEAQRPAHALGYRQVPVVHRVERPAQYADALLAHVDVPDGDRPWNGTITPIETPYPLL